VEDAARSEHLFESWILGVHRPLGLFLSVEVVEVAEKFIKPVHCWQVLITVAEVILAELTRGIAVVLQQFGKGRVLVGSPNLAPGKPTLVRPERTGDWPVMKAARPAVQLCSA
jgi:hypothetical protein